MLHICTAASTYFYLIKPQAESILQLSSEMGACIILSL